MWVECGLGLRTLMVHSSCLVISQLKSFCRLQAAINFASRVLL